MIVLNSSVPRRTALRGILSGSAVTIALPLLDCFLNGNGTALANDQPIPVRFGTWMWSLGMNAKVFVPQKVGADYDLPEQIAPWKDVKEHINVFTNFDAPTDGKPNICHFSGWVALKSGVAPASRGNYGDPSIDVLIGDTIGGASRFRQLDAAATGSPRDSFSFRNSDAVNPPATTVMELYQKIFGPEFQDPNSPNFTPNPSIMVQKSVLSAVSDQSATLRKTVGVADRARLDQYFTSLRDMEQSLALQLQKPPPAPSCRVPAAESLKSPLPGTDTVTVAARHKLMAQLMAMAVACNQTRVFNIAYSGSNGLTKIGLDKSHHSITHEDKNDPDLGYQVRSSWFVTQAMAAYADLIGAFAAIPEGSGTLLDNMVIYANSDQDLAQTHSMRSIPMMVAGKAGGKLKNGLHIDGHGDVGTRVGYTLLKVMGVSIETWGKQSLETSRAVSEMLV